MNFGELAMSCFELILLAVLFFGFLGVAAWLKKTRTPGPSPERAAVVQEGLKYRLVHRSIRAESDEPLPEGDGYYVLRVNDNRRLSWAELPPGLVSFEVAGTSSHEDELQRDTFKPGSTLSLMLEVDNVYDPGAVRICSPDSSTQIGYVPRELAPKIGTALKRDEVVRCVSLWEESRQNRRTGLRVLVVSKGVDFST
jgi:hypothetical protein